MDPQTGRKALFDHNKHGGKVSVANPSHETLVKMFKVDDTLGAVVQGDKGEHYDQSGMPLKNNPQDRARIRDPRLAAVHDGEMNRTYKLLFVPVILLLVFFFCFVARRRFIAGDEGFYLLASRLVLQHQLPYLDFFYQQAPLLPYIYGLWMKLFGTSWFSARILCALITTVLGLLIYQHVCLETRRWAAGLAAVVLYVSSTFVFAWFPIAKAFSLSGLFLFGAYAVVTRLTPASRVWLLAVAGLLFGLSVDTRSYIVGCAPLFLWWIFRHSDTTNRIRRVLWFLGGCTIGIGPALYLFVASPDPFWFNNLGYHAIRTDSGLIGDLGSKMITARRLWFGSDDNGFQFSLLSVISLAATLAMRRSTGGAALLALLIAFVLAAVSFLPTPALVQYFCLCVPFLIVTAVCAISDYIDSLRGEWPKRTASFASVVLLAIFVASSVPSFRRYLFTGDRVIGILGNKDAHNWTVDEVSAVSAAIDQMVEPNEKIASFWPGYIFASKADPYPGFENNFGRTVARKLTVEQMTKYHIISQSDVEADFAAHTPRIAVLGNRTFADRDSRDICDNPSELRDCAKILLSDGYTVVRTIGDASIYRCCSAARSVEMPEKPRYPRVESHRGGR